MYTNRLASTPTAYVTLDAAGNTLSDGPRSFTYDNAGRLQTVSQAGATTSYLYNYLGQRTRKTGTLGTTVYHYDVAGNLIAETRTDGVPIRDYVWVDSTPIAKIEGETLAFLHTDHLNTPRLATDASQTVVWRWEGSAFGETPPTGSATVNLRFPGQYYDAESGLHYNWHRYYDPRIGRYITSDPVSITEHVRAWISGRRATGSLFRNLNLNDPSDEVATAVPLELNSFAYVVNNPLRWTDPTGEGAGAAGGAITGGVLFCLRYPKLCEATGMLATAAAGYVVGAICRTNANDEDCRKERADCRDRCAQAQTDPDLRHLYGGSISQCMRNCLPERCGGEPKWKGYK